jgi:hypothetical protein
MREADGDRDDNERLVHKTIALLALASLDGDALQKRFFFHLSHAHAGATACATLAARGAIAAVVAAQQNWTPDHEAQALTTCSSSASMQRVFTAFVSCMSECFKVSYSVCQFKVCWSCVVVTSSGTCKTCVAVRCPAQHCGFNA